MNEPTRRGPGRPRSAAIAEAMQIDPTEFENAPRNEPTPQRPAQRADGWSRRRKSKTSTPLDIPEHLKDPNMVYQWVAEKVLGAENESHVSDMQEFGGWRHVPADRKGWERVGKNAGRQRGVIETDGLVLYERPKELDIEARQEELSEARGIRATQMERIGLTPKSNLPRQVTKLKRTVEAYQEPTE